MYSFYFLKHLWLDIQFKAEKYLDYRWIYVKKWQLFIKYYVDYLIDLAKHANISISVPSEIFGTQTNPILILLSGKIWFGSSGN